MLKFETELQRYRPGYSGTRKFRLKGEEAAKFRIAVSLDRKRLEHEVAPRLLNRAFGSV
jgi:hypothetical protein